MRLHTTYLIINSKLDMEHNQIYIEDMERASYAYVMSLIAVVIGLPMPIINLIATGIFFLMSRKGSKYVRWHTTQALISQIPLFFLNNILFWWTVRILLFGTPLSGIYLAYFTLVNIYNIADLYATVVSAAKARKGITYRWFMYGVLTDMLIHRKEMDMEEKTTKSKKLVTQSIISAFIFVISLSLINMADWMKICGLKPDSVKVATENVLWKMVSWQIYETTEQEYTEPLDSIVTHLCRSNNIDRKSINLHICKTGEVNAYAMGGRHILVNTGLIANCKTQHELAGIIAHELAHIECGHIDQNTQIQLCMIIAEALLTGGSNSQTEGNVSGIATEIAKNYFMRENENEADDMAIIYMVNARMNPLGIGDFLEHMDDMQLLEFLSTHPDSKKRAARIKEQALQHNTQCTDLLDVEEWLQLRSKAQNDKF